MVMGDPEEWSWGIQRSGHGGSRGMIRGIQRVGQRVPERGSRGVVKGSRRVVRVTQRVGLGGSRRVVRGVQRGGKGTPEAFSRGSRGVVRAYPDG